MSIKNVKKKNMVFILIGSQVQMPPNFSKNLTNAMLNNGRASLKNTIWKKTCRFFPTGRSASIREQAQLQVGRLQDLGDLCFQVQLFPGDRLIADQQILGGWVSTNSIWRKTYAPICKSSNWGKMNHLNPQLFGLEMISKHMDETTIICKIWFPQKECVAEVKKKDSSKKSTKSHGEFSSLAELWGTWWSQWAVSCL